MVVGRRHLQNKNDLLGDLSHDEFTVGLGFPE